MSIVKLNKLLATHQKDNRGDDAAKLKAALGQLKERDLVVILTWQPGVSGDADLEFELKEPTGSVCSSQHRQSPGGGTLTGLNLSSLRKATYTAADAFSGEYEITVKRRLGPPAAGKAR